MHCYQLSSNVYIETFNLDAVLLIADRDVMVTVNHAAAQLYKCARESVGRDDFGRSDCIRFLLKNYDLTCQGAESQMRSILGFGLKHRLVLKKPLRKSPAWIHGVDCA